MKETKVKIEKEKNPYETEDPSQKVELIPQNEVILDNSNYQREPPTESPEQFVRWFWASRDDQIDEMNYQIQGFDKGQEISFDEDGNWKFKNDTEMSHKLLQYRKFLLAVSTDDVKTALENVIE